MIYDGRIKFVFVAPIVSCPRCVLMPNNAQVQVQWALRMSLAAVVILHESIWDVTKPTSLSAVFPMVHADFSSVLGVKHAFDLGEIAAGSIMASKRDETNSPIRSNALHPSFHPQQR